MAEKPKYLKAHLTAIDWKGEEVAEKSYLELHEFEDDADDFGIAVVKAAGRHGQVRVRGKLDRGDERHDGVEVRVFGGTYTVTPFGEAPESSRSKLRTMQTVSREVFNLLLALKDKHGSIDPKGTDDE